jgi:uncharacterized protein (DUF433 family)
MFLNFLKSNHWFSPKTLQSFEGLPPEAQDELMLLLIRASLLPQHAPIRYPSIVKTPNICGGAARLIRTRIPIWVLERMRQLEVAEIDILRSFPTLKAIDLAEAWAYSDDYWEEIAEEIRKNDGDGTMGNE